MGEKYGPKLLGRLGIKVGFRNGGAAAGVTEELPAHCFSCQKRESIQGYGMPSLQGAPGKGCDGRQNLLFV